MQEMPTPAFAARVALLLRYLDAEQGRVFHEFPRISTESATGVSFIRMQQCCSAPVVIQIGFGLRAGQHAHVGLGAEVIYDLGPDVALSV